MKPLTLEETKLKEEMKHNCFWDNIHYKNSEAEKVFNLICHLEDFEVQYWELQQENKQLKMINKEYERLNKENGRGFKITNVQKYNIDELLSYKKYKDNWNKLKEYLEKSWTESQDIWFVKIINKMQELERNDKK